MTASTPRRGDQITTAEQLDALPVGSIFLSPFDAVWRRVEESESLGGYRFESIEYDGRHQAETFARFSEFPLTVLYVPGEQPQRAATGCICEGPSPSSDGPDTDCPQHGQPQRAATEYPSCFPSLGEECGHCHRCTEPQRAATAEDAAQVIAAHTPALIDEGPNGEDDGQHLYCIECGVLPIDEHGLQYGPEHVAEQLGARALLAAARTRPTETTTATVEDAAQVIAEADGLTPGPDAHRYAQALAAAGLLARP